MKAEIYAQNEEMGANESTPRNNDLQESSSHPYNFFSLSIVGIDTLAIGDASEELLQELQRHLGSKIGYKNRC